MIYIVITPMFEWITRASRETWENIYHELREAYGKDRTRITDNNTTWKEELKDMLNLNNSSTNTTINNQLF